MYEHGFNMGLSIYNWCIYDLNNNALILILSLPWKSSKTDRAFSSTTSVGKPFSSLDAPPGPLGLNI